MQRHRSLGDGNEPVGAAAQESTDPQYLAKRRDVGTNSNLTAIDVVPSHRDLSDLVPETLTQGEDLDVERPAVDLLGAEHGIDDRAREELAPALAVGDARQD